MRRRLAALPLLLLAPVLPVVSASAEPAPPAGVARVAGTSPNAVDATSRAAVEAAFWSRVVPSSAVRYGWTGDAATCTAGDVSADYRTWVERTLNFARGLAGLDAVVFDAALSAKAQQGALAKTSGACATPESAEALGRSLVVGTGTYAKPYWAVRTALGTRDAGSGTLLDPTTVRLGFGSTGPDSAFVVRGYPGIADPQATQPGWVTWPTAGYVPFALQPSTWSAQLPGADLSQATVSVTRPDGSVISPSVERPGGADRITWTIPATKSTPPRQAGPDQAYRITVSGARNDAGEELDPHSYTVTLFDVRRPFTVVRPPSVAGVSRPDPHPGDVLQIEPGTGSPDLPVWRSGATWMRDGVVTNPGAPAPTYQVTDADLGHRLTAIVELDAEAPIDFLGGDLMSYMLPVGRVEALQPPLVHRGDRARLAGTPRVGRVLRLRPGRWTPAAADVTLHVTWRVGSTVVRAAADRSRLRLRRTMVGKRVRAVVTATAPGFQDGRSTTRAVKVRGRRA